MVRTNKYSYDYGRMTNFEFVVLFEDQLARCPGMRYLDDDVIEMYMNARQDAESGIIYSFTYSWKSV